MSNMSFDAVVFDLDGVITRTASVHSAAWKQTFDEFLLDRAQQTDGPFREFTHSDDYLPYVDGKPRYKGVASFLESRSIRLPYGNPADPPSSRTICGLGNRKNELFNEMIGQGNVEVFASTVELVHELRRHGVGVGVASSSKNARAVLAAAGLSELFETVVDGVVSDELNLKGKPEPDIFLTACGNLGARADRAVVVEDAVSGVRAAQKGNFGLVLGVAREENTLELRLNGADIVVADLSEIDLARIEKWFSEELEQDQWSVTYHGYVHEAERHREALLTVGNGYLGTRGAQEETSADGYNYPGTYIAGVYNTLASEVAGRTILNEDMVNCPNWLPMTFRVDSGEWVDPNQVQVLEHARRLGFRDGVLHRRMVIRDVAGRETLVESSRVASMAQPHLVALQYCITPLNYSGRIAVRSGLNGQIINSGVERYRQLNSKHLEPVSEGGDGQSCHVVVQTNQSKVQIAEVANHRVRCGGVQIVPTVTHETASGAAYTVFEVETTEGRSICVDKVVAICTSRDKGTGDPLEEAQRALVGVSGFDEVRQASANAWDAVWTKIDIQIEGDRQAQKLLRLNLYHCLVSASPHNAEIDAGIPARGLHGEAYRGHIFWDELFILPMYVLHFPEAVRSVLMYRYRRLDAARVYASEHGYEGAMFPWQSGSSGREETQVLHLNPLSGRWGTDNSSLQRHVSLAIAHNIWRYVWATCDTEFLAEYGAEVFLEICRFWASKAQYNEWTGRYEIAKVMGPDEYHEKYPGAEEGGLKDNGYTNIMVAWALCRAHDLVDMLSDRARHELGRRIDLADGELDRWRDIADRIHIPLSEEGILEQFDGYFGLKELDWDGYRARYGDIARMDRLLKAEGKSPDDYKVSKQADALMTFYVLSVAEIREVLKGTGSIVRGGMLKANLEYYLKRTSHGSTLSRLVHSYLANLAGDAALSWQFYLEALESDFVDIQGGTTGEGIHTGVMAGTAVLALKAYAGLDLAGDVVRIDPRLPAGWREVCFNIGFQGGRYYFVVSPERVDVKVDCIREGPVDIVVRGRKSSLIPSEWTRVDLAEGEF